MKEFIVTVFGSSFPTEGDEEYEMAYEMGKLLGANGYTVCNGGYGGIMEATAKGAKETGGNVIGITTKVFNRAPNQYSDKIISTETHLERLQKLVGLGDAYIFLPGGTGTLLELSYVLEYILKGLIKPKPIISIGDFWKPIIETICREGTKNKILNSEKLITFVKNTNDCIKMLKLLQNETK